MGIRKSIHRLPTTNSNICCSLWRVVLLEAPVAAAPAAAAPGAAAPGAAAPGAALSAPASTASGAAPERQHQGRRGPYEHNNPVLTLAEPYAAAKSGEQGLGLNVP